MVIYGLEVEYGAGSLIALEKFVEIQQGCIEEANEKDHIIKI